MKWFYETTMNWPMKLPWYCHENVSEKAVKSLLHGCGRHEQVWKGMKPLYRRNRIAEYFKTNGNGMTIECLILLSWRLEGLHAMQYCCILQAICSCRRSEPSKFDCKGLSLVSRRRAVPCGGGCRRPVGKNRVVMCCGGVGGSLISCS